MRDAAFSVLAAIAKVILSNLHSAFCWFKFISHCHLIKKFKFRYHKSFSIFVDSLLVCWHEAFREVN